MPTATLDDTSAAFVAAIADPSGDRPLAITVYADWLDERGRHSAGAFWRWAARVRLLPFPFGQTPSRPTWWREDHVFSLRLIGVVPAAVFDRLAAGAPVPSGQFREYDAERSAWADLAAAADAHEPAEAP